jgi:hypothetical protein
MTDYPSHKSPAIVKRYIPLVKTALEVYPEVCEFKPDGVRFSTFVARFRDSISALREYPYEGVSFSVEETEKLSQMRTRVVGSALAVGCKESLRSYKAKAVGQLARADVVGLVHTVNDPTKRTLKAIGQCLEDNIFSSINITGISEDEVAKILPNISITNLGKELVLYAE